MNIIPNNPYIRTAGPRPGSDANDRATRSGSTTQRKKPLVTFDRRSGLERRSRQKHFNYPLDLREGKDRRQSVSLTT